MTKLTVKKSEVMSMSETYDFSYDPAVILANAGMTWH